jgi:Holliday junction resolvase RusA-like endonuclease
MTDVNGRDFIALELPAPISTNDLWRPAKNRTTGKPYMRKSEEYEAWLIEAGYALNRQHPGSVRGWYALTLTVGTQCRLDLDNASKAAIDLLQTHGVIENDRFAARIDLRWSQAVAGLSVMVVKSKAPAGKVAA